MDWIGTARKLYKDFGSMHYMFRMAAGLSVEQANTSKSNLVESDNYLWQNLSQRALS